MRVCFHSLALMFIFLFLGSCSRVPEHEVVLYTSVDEPFARPIVDEFQKRSGIHVTLVTDTEAAKSVGLAERLRAEKDRPRADVFWGNEVFNTIRLAEEGVLARSDLPEAGRVPSRFKDAHGKWAANALRLRMLVSRPDVHIKNLDDLIDPKLKDKIAIARPTAGTTGGHLAAIYLLWGESRANKFFQSLHDNGVKLLGGNSAVADAVARGTLAAGLTDNDDATAAQDEGGKLNALPPDQETIGTLAIPATVSLVTGAPHENAGKQLADYLLSPEVAKKLVDVKFSYATPDAPPANVRLMNVDYAEVAKIMPAAIRSAMIILEGR